MAVGEPAVGFELRISPLAGGRGQLLDVAEHPNELQYELLVLPHIEELGDRPFEIVSDVRAHEPLEPGHDGR